MFFAAYFFNFPIWSGFDTPKIAKIVKFHEFFQGGARTPYRGHAMQRSFQSFSCSVPATWGQCIFLGRLVVVFRSEPGGRKWFFAAYSRGDEILPGCNLRWSFAGF